jgi:dihydroxyacetone kinase-like protein
VSKTALQHTRGEAVPSQTIGAEAVVGYLRRCAVVIRRHRAYLTRLDAALGDGDHGDNMALGFAAVEQELDAMGADRSIGEILRAAGHCLVASVGGASGPLYGTALLEAGFTTGAATTLDAAAVGRMLEAAALAIARRGRCAVGDKTILDALRPAADVYVGTLRSGGSFADAIAAATLAGRDGMRATRSLVARRGLALRLGARSAGHLDPGAVSCFLLLRALVPTRSAR